MKQPTYLYWFVAIVALAIAGCQPVQSPTGEATSAATPTSATDATSTEANATVAEFDQMFIDMMTPHHQSAIEMAQIALERAEHEELRQMAQQMIDSQQADIEQMRTWRQEWYGSSETPPLSAIPMMPGMEGMSEGSTMDMTPMIEELGNATEPFDLAFIDMMLPHHQQAIEAAQMAEQQAVHQETKDLAQKMIEEQQKEIDELTSWRQEWYGNARLSVVVQSG
jgi:uncharacterized protein (DUF305 family)